MKSIAQSIESRIERLLEAGDAQKALQAADRLAKLARGKADKRLLARALSFRASALGRLREFGAAIHARDEERQIYMALEDREALLKWFCDRAMIAHEQKDIAAAERLYDEFESFSLEVGKTSMVGYLYTSHALSLSDISYLSAVKLMERLERFARRQENLKLVATSLANQAGYALPLADIEVQKKALQQARKALDLAKEHEIADLLEHLPELIRQSESILQSLIRYEHSQRTAR